jgi:tRNA 2-thiouridine synthesizing protein A
VPNRRVDCKNMNCPMPIVHISRALKSLEVGEQLEVEATDPAFGADVKAWTDYMGHSLDTFDDGPVKRALITKQTKKS